MILVTGACSGGDDSDEENGSNDAIDAQSTATPDRGPTPTPGAIAETCTDDTSCQERSVEIATRDLAANLDVEPASIVVVSTEASQWPDACLGVSREGVACAQVITPGFRIVLESGGTQYEYHTDHGTRAVLAQ
jgi:hypothetical protein